MCTLLVYAVFLAPLEQKSDKWTRLNVAFIHPHQRPRAQPTEMELHWFLWRLKSCQCIFGISFHVCRWVFLHQTNRFNNFSMETSIYFICVRVFRRINRISVGFSPLFTTCFRRKENWSDCGVIISTTSGKWTGRRRRWNVRNLNSNSSWMVLHRWISVYGWVGVCAVCAFPISKNQNQNKTERQQRKMNAGERT